MSRLKYPPWLSITLDIFYAKENKRYFQALLKHIGLASRYVHKNIIDIENHHVIERIRNLKNIKIKDINFTKNGSIYIENIARNAEYHKKGKKGEWELRDFKDVK
jgi:hypothetical protein